MLDTTAKPDTRSRILEVAESAVLAKGFAATSIDEIVAAVGITKSGFFYHFRDKSALAKGLMLRYMEHDHQVLEEIFARGDELNDDPLHGFLVGLKLFAEMMGNLPEAHPGCLAASFCYQDQLFNREIRDLNAQSTLAWRNRFRARFELIAKRYPPRQPVDFEALADMASTLVEGGLILGRVLQGRHHFAAANSAIPGFREVHLPSRVVNAGSGDWGRCRRPRACAGGRARRP